MIKKPPATRSMSQNCADFNGLLSSFERALEKALKADDIQLLVQDYNGFSANSEHDKRSPMDQAFREILLLRLIEDVEKIGALVKLSVAAARAEIVSNTIPVVLLGDTFDAVTLDKCEQIFQFVEQLVEVWKEEIFFASCKNNILRMCNDLLRRLSRTQNTVFCGRILLFLSKFFPFSERSGLNIVSEFNLENVTDYGVDNKDLDDTLEDTAEDIPIKIDYNLYCKFWSLQDFFRNPNQCYSKAQWKMFQTHASTILESFSSFKLEDLRQNTDDVDSLGDSKMDTDDQSTDNAAEQTVRKSNHFFAKFLTNPKLLALQLSDSNFRRSVLVQFLILFQYLQLVVKFKNESNTLTTAQTDFIKETESKVYKLLEETPPNGRRFARTVQHMLMREEMWNNWKNDGCKEFKKPVEDEPNEESDESKPSPPKRSRRPLGECLRESARNGKFFLGHDILTRLWNYSPDNLQACKSEERNFLPQFETYLENPREKHEPSFEWRALRLLARQTPHFFTFANQPSCKTSDYLESLRKRLIREKEHAKIMAGAASNNANGNGNDNGQHSVLEQSEQENDGLQDGQVAEHDTVGDLDEDEHADLDKADEDQNPRAKSITINKQYIEQIAPLIGDNWMKLGKKIGFTPDELLYFETEHPEPSGGCMAMLTNWSAEDVDATLDNWAYMLEGLELNAAAEAVKALIERANENSDKDIEVLSD